MTTRIIAVVTIVALLNSILGCAHRISIWRTYSAREKVSQDEIEVITPKEKIVGVVLPSSEEITFDEWGGRFNPNEEVIMGIDQDGGPIEIHLDDVRYIKVEKVEAGESSVTSFDAEAFKHLEAFQFKQWEAFNYEKESAAKIVAVMLFSGDEITFDKSGGNVDARKRTIWGKTQDGTPVEVKLDQVYYLKVRESDPGAEAVAYLLVVGIVVAFIIAIEAAYPIGVVP